MKLRILAAICLVQACAASAQTPLPQLRIEPIGGGSVFYVKNISSQPLTAYLIELVDYPGSSYSLLQDELDKHPIAPGEERRMQVGNMTVGAVPDYVKLQAVLYADGSTAGIPEKITQLIDRRRHTLQELRDTIGRLKADSSKEQIVDSLKHSNKNKVLGDTLSHLESHTVKETLDWLRDRESVLASSKPAL